LSDPSAPLEMMLHILHSAFINNSASQYEKLLYAQSCMGMLETFVILGSLAFTL
jgi:hypothetical protein